MQNPWNITDNELVTALAHNFTKNGTHLKNFLGFYHAILFKNSEKQQVIHTLLICCKAITF